MKRRAASLRVYARTLWQSIVLGVLAIGAWGTLLLVATVHDAFVRGPAPALARLLPAPGTTEWGWLGAFSAGLALLSWTALGLSLALSRLSRPRRPPASDPSAERSHREATAPAPPGPSRD